MAKKRTNSPPANDDMVDSGPLSDMLHYAIDSMAPVTPHTPVVGVMVVVMLPDPGPDDDITTLLAAVHGLDVKEFAMRTLQVVVGDCIAHGFTEEELHTLAEEAFDEA